MDEKHTKSYQEDHELVGSDEELGNTLKFCVVTREVNFAKMDSK